MRSLVASAHLPAFREKLHRGVSQALGPTADFVWSPLPLIAPVPLPGILTFAIRLVWTHGVRRACIAARGRGPGHYFRHLPEGELARTGDWSDDERRLFLERLRELWEGATACHWGIFSLAIPGRSGGSAAPSTGR
jgi:hypothetical protein